MRVTLTRGEASPLLQSPAEAAPRAVAEAVLRAWPKLQRCTVILTNNRTRVLSWRAPTKSSLELRVARTVLERPQDIAAVVTRKDERAWARLAALHQTERPADKAPVDAPQGQFHDLAPLCERARVHTPELSGPIPLRWGRWPSRAPRRRIQLGACDGVGIRVHPVLDHRSTPDWFLAVLLHHELLHLVIPPTRGPSGRRIVHPRAFRLRERAHPDHARALAWERANVPTLLRRIQRRI